MVEWRAFNYPQCGPEAPLCHAAALQEINPGGAELDYYGLACDGWGRPGLPASWTKNHGAI